jgi:hypothetical protein
MRWELVKSEYLLARLQPQPPGWAHPASLLSLFLLTLMPKAFTSLRLPLLALLTSFALTSCFERDKKCDPKPSNWCGTGTKTPTPTTSGTK